MFLFILPHLLLTYLHFLQHATAAVAPGDLSPNTNTNSLVTPPPATPDFSLGDKIPFPPQPAFPLLKMLFLTCEGLYTFAPFPYTAAAPRGETFAGTLSIRIERAHVPHSAFQIRHAMWALWLGAARQLEDGDYRPGIFPMDVASSTPGGPTRSVGSITYRNDNRRTAAMVGAGNGTDGGDGAIEPLVAGVDVTSRRRSRSRRQHQQGDGFDVIMATRQWSSPTNSTTTTTVSFPGFNTTTTTSSSPPANPANAAAAALNDTNFYSIQITGTSAKRISLTAVFTTVYETMVLRASLPDRDLLTRDWIYTSQSSGYALGLRPAPEMPVGQRAPFEAMMGGMANLPRALQSGKVFTEVMFNVLEGETDEKLLEGFLVVGRGG